MCFLGGFTSFQPHFTSLQPQKSGFLMIISHFLSLFLAKLPFKLSWKLEIMYAYFIEVLDVVSGGGSRLFSQISFPHRLTKVVFSCFFSFFEFISSLQIVLEILT